MAIPDFIREALERAPMGEEDLTPDEVAELEKRAAEMRAGRARRIPHAEIQDMIVRMRPLAG